jgi:hypothetical protein
VISGLTARPFVAASLCEATRETLVTARRTPPQGRQLQSRLQSPPTAPMLPARCRESSSMIRASASQGEADFDTMMRLPASSLLRCLTVAAHGSRRVHSRRKEAEFPAASQNACRLLEGPFRGRRAAGCASIGALRSFNNSVNIEDQHEISFIRETLAPSARRVPKTGRSRSWSALSGHARESSQEDVLAAGGCFFWQRSAGSKTGCAIAQRHAATRTAGAQT